MTRTIRYYKWLRSMTKMQWTWSEALRQARFWHRLGQRYPSFAIQLDRIMADYYEGKQ